MKRILVFILFAIVSCSLLVACSAPPVAGAQLPNPMVEYDSASEMNKVLKFDMLQLPAELEYTPKDYYVIDKRLGQIDYTNQAEDLEITLRKAKGNEDISGIYGVDYEQESFSGLPVNMGIYEDTHVAWFEDGGFSYSVSATGIDGATFDTLVGTVVTVEKTVE